MVKQEECFVCPDPQIARRFDCQRSYRQLQVRARSNSISEQIFTILNLTKLARGESPVCVYSRLTFTILSPRCCFNPALLVPAQKDNERIESTHQLKLWTGQWYALESHLVNMALARLTIEASFLLSSTKAFLKIFLNLFNNFLTLFWYGYVAQLASRV